MIAVIDVEAHRGYSLSVQQTPTNLAKREATAQSQHPPQRITGAMIEQSRQMLDQLSNKATAGAEFQIEFIFRDAKQFTGLCDAQTRQPQTLDFHFNASLSALNLAKYEDQLRVMRKPGGALPMANA